MTLEISSKFETFLNSHRYKKDVHPYFTHTEMNTSKGAYYIADSDYNQFITLYTNFINNGFEIGMVERHNGQKVGPVICDFDFRSRISKRSYTQEHIKNIIKIFIEILQDLFIINEDQLQAFVYEKDKPTMDKKDNDIQYKDGFHIYFPYAPLLVEYRYLIYELVYNKLKENGTLDDIPSIEPLTEVFDPRIIYSNGIMMYGSSKPGRTPYELTRVYNKDFSEVEIELFDIETKMQTSLLRSYDDDDSLQLKSKHKSLINRCIKICKDKKYPTDLKGDLMNETETEEEPEQKPVKKEINKIEINFDLDNTEILNNIIKKERLKKERLKKAKEEKKEQDEEFKKIMIEKLQNNNTEKEKSLIALLDCLDKKRFEQYNEWLKLTTIIKFNFGDDCYNIFDSYNKKYKGYDSETNRKIWDNIKYEKVTMGSLIFMCKEDNETKYKEYQKIYNTDFNISEKLLAKYIEKYNSDYIIQDGIMYYFNYRTWECGKNAEYLMKGYISTIFYDFMISDIFINYSHTREYPEIIKNLHRYCMSTKHKESIIKTLFDKNQTYNNNNQILFDSKPNIFMFTNGYYDLDENKFVMCNKKTKEQFRNLYITIDCGYNYETPKQEDIKFMHNFINKIFTNEQHKNKCLEILSTGLIGKIMQHFYIFVGHGSNGKSLIMEYVKRVLGVYFNIGQIELILSNSKATSDAKGKLHNKRLTLFQEADTDNKIKNSTLKEFTGESKIVGKLLYENSREINNHSTYILFTNEIPEFKSNIGNGEYRRIEVIQFNSTFTDDEKMYKIDNITVFKADKSLDSGDMQEKYKHALFSILVEAYQNFKNRGYQYEDIKEFEKAKEKYLNNANSTLNSLNAIIEKNEEKNNKNRFINWIKIKNIYELMKRDETYMLMSYEEKRKLTKQKLEEFLQTNILYKNNYEEYRKVKYLQGYKFKIPEYIDEENIEEVNKFNEEYNYTIDNITK